MTTPFSEVIRDTIEKHFPNDYEGILGTSDLIKYIHTKTKSANSGSKSRGAFGNLYAIYVLVEDYVAKGFHKKGEYKSYEGARFTTLLTRQRELPFGQKLQNHALNHRLNEEFRGFFPMNGLDPILRDVAKNRYWFNENLLKITVNKEEINLAEVIIAIIDRYVDQKRDAFQKFIQTCESLKNLEFSKPADPSDVVKFIIDLMAPNVDARIFEIVSYAILKYHYSDQSIYWGFEMDSLEKENLKLFKTGRTNANDGGIDFVMKPLGRFFQVTETLDTRKYFLDIDKLQKFPVTFVIKTDSPPETINEGLLANARKQYVVDAIVKKYMDCIEEIINIPILKQRFQDAVKQGYLNQIIDEIIVQSKVEFNYEEDASEEEDADASK